jgi:hypothetical protein
MAARNEDGDEKAHLKEINMNRGITNILSAAHRMYNAVSELIQRDGNMSCLFSSSC